MTARDRASQAVEQATDFILRQIEDGSWGAGQKLPTERELAQRFGVARNTLRKGIQLLEDQGKLVRQVGRGTFVANGHEGVPPGDGQEATLWQRIHGASPVEVMEARLMIEPQIIELAAARATMDDLAAIQDAMRRGEAAADTAEFEVWDGLLHQRILGAARNQLLTDIYEAINAVRGRAEWGKLKERILTPQRRAEAEAQHRTIVAALLERDGDAARSAMRAHLLAVRATFGTL